MPSLESDSSYFFISSNQFVNCTIKLKPYWCHKAFSAGLKTLSESFLSIIIGNINEQHFISKSLCQGFHSQKHPLKTIPRKMQCPIAANLCQTSLTATHAVLRGYLVPVGITLVTLGRGGLNRSGKSPPKALLPNKPPAILIQYSCI